MSEDQHGNLFDDLDRPGGAMSSGPTSARRGGDHAAAPLAERMRPRHADELYGQEHLVGDGRLLRRILEGGEPTSLILWGPPGVGKTTIARLMADAADASFQELSATLAGVRQVREIADGARRMRHHDGRRTVLFLDEIHRFNKAQQDTLLPYVESGDLILMGATTENPSFEVVAPLLSRCRVVRLAPLSEDELVKTVRRALTTAPPRGLKGAVTIDDGLLRAIAAFAEGDARVALTTIEIAAALCRQRHPADSSPEVSESDLREAMQSPILRYDKHGEEHFNEISALHKSVRNSDPDAALYWLARMLEAGEDPLYVARRLVRMASEDVGLADPAALPLAVSAFHAVRAIGLPEGALSLAQVAVHLALAPKSNAVYQAYGKATDEVRRSRNLAVPLRLRNAPTRLMKEFGYGDGYEYAHGEADAVTAMECLPEELAGVRFYVPSGRGYEADLGRRIEEIEAWREKLRADRDERSSE